MCHSFLAQNKQEPQFRSRLGVVQGKVLEDDQLQITWPSPLPQGEFKSFSLGKKSEEFFVVNTGVPHVLVEAEPQENLAKLIRNHPSLQPQGANVTFVHEESPGETEAVTFERGVEDFTLSCGTGAMAAAVFSKEKNPLLKKHLISMPGGVLQVSFATSGEVTLQGEASREFEMRFQSEDV